MRNITGPPVQNDNFFGREKEIDYIWSKLIDGNNYIFPSPRRVGKTSFALKLIDVAQDKGWRTIHINLEKYDELKAIETFTEKLTGLSQLKAIKKQGKILFEFINQLKPQVNVAGVDFQLNWKHQQKEVYDQLEKLLDHNEPTLIFLDELTVLLDKIVKEENGLERVSTLLHWLRGARIVPDSKIRWVYCSSVGIENFTHTHSISETLNDTKDYLLKSFDNDASSQMLHSLSLGQNITLSDDCVQRIIEKLEDCIPYFLQIVFEKIHSLHVVDNKVITPELVDEAYELLLDENHFNTWIERLKKQYGDLHQHALFILRHICQEKKGSSRRSILNKLSTKNLGPDETEEVLSKLIYMLKNDGYLIVDGTKYRFRSPLLRDFWFKRHVL